MPKRILVPLDETLDAEMVLPFLTETTRGSGATVRLLHVAPPPSNVLSSEGHVVAYADQETSRIEGEKLDYLRRVGTEIDGVTVECVVRFGDPTEEILAEAKAFDAELIAMTTRSRSGLGRLLLGSVAEQVLRKAPAAVILFRDAQ